MGDCSVHFYGGVNVERQRRQLPTELPAYESRVRMPTVLDEDEETTTTPTTTTCGGSRPEAVPSDDATSSYAADSTRSRIVGQSATVDRVKQKRKRRHRVAATTSETALSRREDETTPRDSHGASPRPPRPDDGSGSADVNNTGGLLSPAVYGSCGGASPRPWTDNEWCECSSCHSVEVVSLPASCYATDRASAAVSPSGVGGVRSNCKRCAGCAAVNPQCLSSGSATAIDPSGASLAPTISSSSGLVQTGSVTAEVPKVRLKVVYYHNRFVAVPVNSPPLPQAHKVAPPAASTSTANPVTMASSVGSVPSSVVVPIVMPQCPTCSLSGIVPDMENRRPIDSRPLPNPSSEVTISDREQSHGEQQRTTRTLLRRIIDCLEDRDDKLSKDDSVNRPRRRRSRRRTSGTANPHSPAFDTLVKIINWCFLIIGLLLFLGVIAVIIYTAIGNFVFLSHCYRRLYIAT